MVQRPGLPDARDYLQRDTKGKAPRAIVVYIRI